MDDCERFVLEESERDPRFKAAYESMGMMRYWANASILRTLNRPSLCTRLADWLCCRIMDVLMWMERKTWQTWQRKPDWLVVFDLFSNGDFEERVYQISSPSHDGWRPARYV